MSEKSKVKVDELTIDGTVYVPRDSVVVPDYSDSDVKIVVLQRSWVVVGFFSQEGDVCTLERAKIIRRWGTKRGLGELAAGPTSNTILDEGGHVEFNVGAVVLTISCARSGWAGHLK